MTICGLNNYKVIFMKTKYSKLNGMSKISYQDDSECDKCTFSKSCKSYMHLYEKVFKSSPAK